MADSCYLNDKFLSTNTYEIVFLVLSNLFLLLPAIKAYYLHEYLRALLLFMSFLFSSFYHLCKTASVDASYCIIPLCGLLLLDYSFSYTNIISSILYFLDFGAVYKKLKKFHKHSVKLESDRAALPPAIYTKPMHNLKNKDFMVQRDTSFIEMWIIISTGVCIAILVYQNGFKSLTTLQLCIIIGIEVGIVLIGWLYNYLNYSLLPDFNIAFLVVSLTIGAVGFTFFQIVDFFSISIYWWTHTIWHILMSFAQLYLLEARNFRKSTWFLCCFK